MRLLLDITNECNFACKTCIREYHRGDNLSFKLLKNIYSQSKNFTFSEVSFTGGEPVLHPNFEEIVRITVKNNMKFSFVSNGYFINKYKFILQKYKKFLTGATFSLDGATKQIHDTIRQKGSYEKVLDSVNYFVKNKSYVYLTTCLNKLNKHHISRLIKLAIKLQVKGIKFTTAIETAYNKAIVLNDLEKLNCFLQINSCFNKHRNKINIYISHALYTKGGLNFCSRMNELSTLTINPQGNALFCCDTTGYGYIIGSLNKESLLQIYEKYIQEISNLKKIRLQMIIKNKKIPGFNTCEFCNYYYKNLKNDHV